MSKKLRCTIYTRKSTEEGLEQDFNSLDAQREACEAYIKSQQHEGWKLLPDHYDDGGISGGTMVRPALQRLLDEVRAGRVDIPESMIPWSTVRPGERCSQNSKRTPVRERSEPIPKTPACWPVCCGMKTATDLCPTLPARRAGDITITCRGEKASRSRPAAPIRLRGADQ